MSTMLRCAKMLRVKIDIKKAATDTRFVPLSVAALPVLSPLRA
jgi:hypothetical protein